MIHFSFDPPDSDDETEDDNVIDGGWGESIG